MTRNGDDWSPKRTEKCPRMAQSMTNFSTRSQNTSVRGIWPPLPPNKSVDSRNKKLNCHSTFGGETRFMESVRSMSPWGEKYYSHAGSNMKFSGREAVFGVSVRPNYIKGTPLLGPGRYQVENTRPVIYGGTFSSAQERRSLRDDAVPGPGSYHVNESTLTNKKLTILLPFPDLSPPANESPEVPKYPKLPRTVRSTFGEAPRRFCF